MILLKGIQLTLPPEVMSYELENLPRPGEQMMTSRGSAVVTRLQPVGHETLVWADYGSGIEQPHVREDVTCNLRIVLGGKTTLESEDDTPLIQEDDSPPKPESKACGWIGWKETRRERKRRDPWVGRQAWLYWEKSGGKKRSRYIPRGKLAAVQESVYELRRTIAQTLEILEK